VTKHWGPCICKIRKNENSCKRSSQNDRKKTKQTVVVWESGNPWKPSEESVLRKRGINKTNVVDRSNKTRLEKLI
jgi:hypothetical protein